jgi:hypothetical protein
MHDYYHLMDQFSIELLIFDLYFIFQIKKEMKKKMKLCLLIMIK